MAGSLSYKYQTAKALTKLVDIFKHKKNLQIAGWCLFTNSSFIFTSTFNLGELANKPTEYLYTMLQKAKGLEGTGRCFHEQKHTWKLRSCYVQVLALYSYLHSSRVLLKISIGLHCSILIYNDTNSHKRLEDSAVFF